jgi:hypothetical protein
MSATVDPAGSKSNMRVLIVDDNRVALTVLKGV